MKCSAIMEVEIAPFLERLQLFKSLVRVDNDVNSF